MASAASVAGPVAKPRASGILQAIWLPHLRRFCEQDGAPFLHRTEHRKHNCDDHVGDNAPEHEPPVGVEFAGPELRDKSECDPASCLQAGCQLRRL